MRKIYLVLGLAIGALVVPALPVAQAQTTCNGLPVTIFGKGGDDIIVGTPENDVIAAEAGNDTVFALEGTDTVCLGPGDDTLDGGPGADTSVS
jgi:Ca2+-binding RTX toxin-like protein